MTLKGHRILVTGVTGFIGRHLTRHLFGVDAELFLLARPDRAAALTDEVQGQVPVLAADLADSAALEQAVRQAQPTVVFHLAAYTDPMRDPSRQGVALAANAGGTIALASACMAAETTTAFVAAGTCEEYGRSERPLREDMPLRPLSPYSASKAAASVWLGMMHDTFGFPAVVVRPFLCYGPGQAPPKLVPSAIHHALGNRDFPMTDGSQTRELTYVSDVVEGFLAAATHPAARGEAFNLGSGEEHRVIDLVSDIYRLVGGTGRPLPGALPNRPNEMNRFVADTGKAMQRLGWRASTSLGDGLDRTIRWSRQHGDRPVPLAPNRPVGSDPQGQT